MEERKRERERCFENKSLEIRIVNLLINNESWDISSKRSGWDNERGRGWTRRCGMGTCYRATHHRRSHRKIIFCARPKAERSGAFLFFFIPSSNLSSSSSSPFLLIQFQR